MAYLITEIFKLPYEEQFFVIKHGLENAKKEEISKHISPYGFVPEKVDYGINLVSTAQDYHYHQKKQYGEQYSATEKLRKLKANAEKRIGATIKIAKIAIEDRGLQKSLGLHKSRNHSVSGWISQTHQFYRNVTDEVITYLSEFGYTKDKIDEERALLNEVIKADKKQDNDRVDAQRATINRDEAIDTLHNWCRKFYKVSKIALSDHPQLMEKLGVIDRN